MTFLTPVPGGRSPGDTFVRRFINVVVNVVSGLFPSEDLFPSESLFPRD